MALISYLAYIMKLFSWILIVIFSIGCFLQTNFTYADASIPTTVLSTESFQKLGIELRENLANNYYTGDGILIRGRVTNKKEYAMVFLQNAKTGEELSELARTDSSGYFEIPFSLPKVAGKYYIVIASGNSFESSTPETITIVSRSITPDSGATILSTLPSMVYDTASYLSFGSGVWSNMSINQ